MKPLSLSRPHLIVMIGIPGSGKSTFAERFSTTFKAPLVSQTVFEELLYGTKYGTPEQEAEALRIVDTMLGELLKTSQTIIYEDASGSRQHRQDLAKRANQAGYTPLFVWVQTDSNEASRRAMRKVAGKTAISAEQFEAAVRRFTVPVASEQAIVISGRHTYATQLKNVLRNLTAERARRPLHVPKRTIQ